MRKGVQGFEKYPNLPPQMAPQEAHETNSDRHNPQFASAARHLPNDSPKVYPVICSLSGDRRKSRSSARQLQ